MIFVLFCSLHNNKKNSHLFRLVFVPQFKFRSNWTILVTPDLRGKWGRTCTPSIAHTSRSTPRWCFCSQQIRAFDCRWWPLIGRDISLGSFLKRYVQIGSCMYYHYYVYILYLHPCFAQCGPIIWNKTSPFYKRIRYFVKLPNSGIFITTHKAMATIS